MTPNIQQLEHAIKNFQTRVEAKTLECVALKQLLRVAGDVIGGLGIEDALGLIVTRTYPAIAECPASFTLEDAVNNYLTAKFNQAVIDLEELNLRLREIQHQRSGIVLPGLSLNSKPHQ